MKREEVLDSARRQVVKTQIPVLRTGNFLLSGGTALALRLGHRTSRDLDWFTAKPFEAQQVATALEQLPNAPTRVQVSGSDTLRAYYQRLPS